MANNEYKLLPMTEADLNNQIRPKLMAAENRYQLSGGEPTFWSIFSSLDEYFREDTWLCLKANTDEVDAILQCEGSDIYLVAALGFEKPIGTLKTAIELAVEKIKADGHLYAVFHTATSEVERAALEDLNFIAGPEQTPPPMFCNSCSEYVLGFPESREIPDRTRPVDAKFEVFGDDILYNSSSPVLASFEFNGWLDRKGVVQLEDRFWLYKSALNSGKSIYLRIFINGALWYEAKPYHSEMARSGMVTMRSTLFYFDEICPNLTHQLV